MPLAQNRTFTYFLLLLFIQICLFSSAGNVLAQNQWGYGFEEQNSQNQSSKSGIDDPSRSFNGLLNLVKNKAKLWDDKLRSYAKTVFWLLAAIQFVWIFFPLIFKQADFGEILGELVRFIMIIGFFYALLLLSREWAEIIVDSFRKAGAHAAGISGTEIQPGDVFDVAVELAQTVGGAVSLLSPVYSVIIAISALMILLCFTFIAIFMGLTIIESYIVINASVLFMGFGASQWTREYAVMIFRYAVV